MTTLTNKDFENFWIRCYLSTSTRFVEGAIKRAYLDFNRTVHGIRITESPEKYQIFENFFKDLINETTSQKFENQRIFDSWHKNKCEKLISLFKEHFTPKIHIGQAQKWINMTLKYLVALGNDRIKDISLNYIFFHIPVDNIIQEKLSKMGISKFSVPWSQIDDYRDYINYQISVRNKFAGQLPMDVEFRLFNE
jgi:hypothetical protein